MVSESTAQVSFPICLESVASKEKGSSDFGKKSELSPASFSFPFEGGREEHCEVLVSGTKEGNGFALVRKCGLDDSYAVWFEHGLYVMQNGGAHVTVRTNGKGKLPCARLAL